MNRYRLLFLLLLLSETLLATMHLMPGAPVMRSKDLVHWSIASYVFDSLTDHPKYNLTNGTVYGRGQGRASAPVDALPLGRWLARGDFNLHKDRATFYYSLDNKSWQAIGSPFIMRFDYTRHFMGTKFAIFNYATRQTGGYVDVDFFHYQRQPH